MKALTVEEAAKVLNLSPAHVRRRAPHARMALMEALGYQPVGTGRSERPTGLTMGRTL